MSIEATLSAVGLALAAIPLVPVASKLLRLWIQFIDDARDSDRDWEKIRKRFDQNCHRYASLQNVLFLDEKFPFVRGRLFDDLPSPSQQTIFAMLRELPVLLYKYYLIESRRTGSGSQKYLDFSNNNTLASAAILNQEEMELLFREDGWVPDEVTPKSTLFSKRNIWWAMRTKTRVEHLLVEYDEWLRRMRETVEDCWWPLSFFDKYVNVKSLEDDPDCQKVGLSLSAGARKLLLSDAVFDRLELPDPLRRMARFDNYTRSVALLGNSPVLVEELHYDPDDDGFLPDTLKRRFEQIAALLKQNKDAEFRALPCEGYKQCTSAEPNFQLVSRIPEAVDPQPQTLFDIISSVSFGKPSLGDRFLLGHQLSQSMSLFHSVGWRHRAFRSSNVLYFQSPGSSTSPSDRISLHNPYICGFEASRLQPETSSGPYDNDIICNIYRHPDRWGTPKKEFNKAHDIYGRYPL